MIRRLCLYQWPQYKRSISMKKAALQYGLPAVLFYWVTNEIIVCGLTYMLHYGYFGKSDLIAFLEKIGCSRFVNLEAIETKSWVLWDGYLEISARLLANFMAASAFMSIWTPIQFPLAIAIYPYFRSLVVFMFGSRTTRTVLT